jgi:large subunit ribosomal protein L9
MKLILKQNVEKVGKIGEVVEVKPGFARNYLLPRGMASHVTPGITQEIEAKARREAKAQAERDKEMRSIADQLGAASVTIPAKVNPEGRLFGSVGAKDIQAALAADGFGTVTEAMIEMPESLKEPGVYEINIKLSGEIAAKTRIWIVPE